MNPKKEFYINYNELRKKTEYLLQQTEDHDFIVHEEKNIQKLIEQLEISYTELNLQNDILKETQTQLELSHKYYNHLFQYAPIGYMIMNTKGEITNINLSAAKTLGLDAQMLEGKHFQSFITVDQLDIFDQCIQKIRTKGTPQSCDILINVTSNKEIWVRLFLRLQNADDFQIEEIFCAMMDISYEKQMNISLEQKVKERTKEAEEARLRAEALSKAKDEFLASMSHEIRTPMNGIMGMGQMLLETHLTSQQREYAKTIVGSSEVLMSIINDILDLSKIEAGKLELSSTPFDIRTVIDNTVKVISPKIYEKLLEFAAIFHSDIPPMVFGDPIRLNQILLNLLGNAIKFTDTGEIVLKTSLQAFQKDTVVIRFEIRDTGIGIPEHQKHNLFEPFAQISDSILHKASGTGLGLSISKKIIQKIGGDIGFDSEYQKGSTFWVTMPLKRQKKQAHTDYNKKMDNPRILIIEPYDKRRIVLREYFMSLRLSMDETNSGKTGCSMLEEAARNKRPYQLCFVDPYIPVEDPLMFWQFIENSTILSSTQMIAIVSPLESHAAFSGLFYDQLTKPITWTGLCRVFNNYMEETFESSHPKFDSTSESPQNHEYHILVVEDDIANQIIIGNVLKQEGYRVSLVENGKEAILFLQKSKCHLIIMDLLMPELNGIDTTKIIRNPSSDIFDAQIPIIAMTANVMQIHKQLCLEAGMNDFLSKPVHLKQIRKTIKKWLSPIKKNTDSIQTTDFQGKLFDIDKMRNRLENNQELLKSTIDLFIKIIPDLYKKLKDAVDIGDVQAIEIRAHTIKGNAINISSEPLANISKQIEFEAKKGNIERIQSLMPSLDVMIKRVIQKISKIKPLNNKISQKKCHRILQ